MSDLNGPPDAVPARVPALNLPGVVVALIASFVAVFLWYEYAADQQRLRGLLQFAFAPGQLTAQFDPGAVVRGIEDAGTGDDRAAFEIYFLDNGDFKPWRLVTYAFLHGSWSHLIFNALWMMVFGSALARRIGDIRFLALMAACAAAGALAHWLSQPLSLAPMIGASACVSGAIGAASRFIFQPGAPLGLPAGERQASRSPALPLLALGADRRAIGFLGVWMAFNLLFGLGANIFGGLADNAPVAWQAHIGGLLAGLLLLDLFDPRGR